MLNKEICYMIENVLDIRKCRNFIFPSAAEDGEESLSGGESSDRGPANATVDGGASY